MEVRQFDGSGQPIAPATETTLSSVKSAVESLAQEDFSTETTLAALKDLIGALDDSKEQNPDAANATLLSLIRGLLAKDFATQTTLAALKAEVDKLTGLIDSDALKVALTGSLVPVVVSAQISIGSGVTWDSDVIDVQGYRYITIAHRTTVNTSKTITLLLFRNSNATQSYGALTDITNTESPYMIVPKNNFDVGGVARVPIAFPYVKLRFSHAAQDTRTHQYTYRLEV